MRLKLLPFGDIWTANGNCAKVEGEKKELGALGVESRLMHLKQLGLAESPFHKRGRPIIFVPYRSQQEAFKFLGDILKDDRGIGLLHGPVSSGKTVLIEQFVRELQTDVAFAIVDGARLKTHEFLSSVLTQFGYDVELNSADELLRLLSVFAAQQSRTRQSPLLIIENINDMYPSALGSLCKLAELTANGKFSFRIVLASNRNFARVIESPSMSIVAKRLIGEFELESMTAKESSTYLYAKLRSCGAQRPDDIFSVDVCDKLHTAAGGRPGRLDDIAMSVIEQADHLPIQVQAIDCSDAKKDHGLPQLVITHSGNTVQELKLTVSRAIIGRSDLSDIVIEDKFVSKQHALLVREQDALILVDLKSANGTFVNSRQVQTAVLRDTDIISLGDHRIKLIYANSPAISDIDDADVADTASMKNIADARRARAKRYPALLRVDGKKA